MCFQGLELLQNIREVDILSATGKQSTEVVLMWSFLAHIIVLCFVLIFNVNILAEKLKVFNHTIVFINYVRPMI